MSHELVVFVQIAIVILLLLIIFRSPHHSPIREGATAIRPPGGYGEISGGYADVPFTGHRLDDNSSFGITMCTEPGGRLAEC